MTIEERAYKDWGETNNPFHACWMTTDGRMLNGSYEDYQRDRDHRDISFYFTRSVREDPGSSQIYLRKFENRGNIRMSCTDFEFCFEISRTVTEKQLSTMRKIASIAERTGIPCTVVKRVGGLSDCKANTYYFDEYVEHLDKRIGLPNLK